MRVLAITGDAFFVPGHARYDLQANAVERFEVLYWGPSALFPKIPKGDFDVITPQDPFFRGFIGLFLKRRYKARLNVQLHADLEAQSFLKRSIARFVLRRADSIRVVSARAKEQIEKMGVKVPVTILPVFVELGRFKSIVRSPSERPTILWIGRFEDEKNPLLALRIARSVREKGIDANLIMLGTGLLEASLRKEVEGLSVEFPGWQDPAPFLTTAHVVLSTSRAESFGVSIVEALAAGVPVVAPDVGIARDAGAIVVPQERLVDAVCEVLLTAPKTSLKINLPTQEEWVQIWKQSL